MYFHVNEYDFIIFFSMPLVNLYIFANQDKIDFFFYFFAKTYLTELSFFEK